MDIDGLRAIYNLVMDIEDEEFPNWCRRQNALETFYGRNVESAVEGALAHAIEQGLCIINYPSRLPWIQPLIHTLLQLVGNYQGYLARNTCDCNEGHERAHTVCTVCHTRYVTNILAWYVHQCA